MSRAPDRGAAASGGIGDGEPAGIPVQVIDNVAEGRFEVAGQGELASLIYSIEGGKLYLMHTDVSEALEGRGYGSALVRAAMEHAEHEHLRVVPWCLFARAYLRRHPEYDALITPE
jgi:predicted GNAT family acetyltransferase